MDIRALIIDSLRNRLFLNVLFFLLFRKRLQILAARFENSSEGTRKRSPFIYNLR
jgi:hypothetical protein